MASNIPLRVGVRVVPPYRTSNHTVSCPILDLKCHPSIAAETQLTAPGTFSLFYVYVKQYHHTQYSISTHLPHLTSTTITIHYISFKFSTMVAR